MFFIIFKFNERRSWMLRVCNLHKIKKNSLQGAGERDGGRTVDKTLYFTTVISPVARAQK